MDKEIETLLEMVKSAKRKPFWQSTPQEARSGPMLMALLFGEAPSVERDESFTIPSSGGFDLPVLHYRALKHGIAAPRYWDQGEDDREFKFNNYISRFHSRHTDLMDLIAGYQARAVQPLDQIATLLGFPGKMGMSGAKVWDAYLDGDLAGIRNYCETDVLNTWLVYLRFQLMRGHLDTGAYEQELELTRQLLQNESKPHFTEFLDAWQQNSAA